MDYKSYVNTQKDRFTKNRVVDNQSIDRKKYLVDYGAKYINYQKINDVLLVGTSNENEMYLFHNQGIKNVVGIDISSHYDTILEMDMHEMTFEGNSFDLIYASHSLEHSYDADKVMKEFIRVLKPKGYIIIEIPVNFEPNDIDRFNFQNSVELYNLFARFGMFIIIAGEELKVNQKNNYCGTDVSRMILKLNKK